MSPTPATSATAPTCDLCASPMRERTGSRGPFWGCIKFPACKGTKRLTSTAPARPAASAPIDDDWPSDPSAPATPSREAAGELITDLRKAAGHLGAAIDILRRRGPQLDGLLSDQPDDDPDSAF